jgi:guanylate kinase
VELRAYDTVYGVWKYFTVDDGAIDLRNHDYLYIVTLEGYVRMQKYFGKDRVVPLYIEVEDGERLLRAIARERQGEPKYEEMCRRFLADAADFSEEKLAAAGIEKRFYNRNLEETIREVTEYIKRISEWV